MILLLSVVALVLFLVHQFWWRRRDLPDGPLPLPFIGNIHSMWNYSRWEDKLIEWKKQYGTIYTYWIGPMPVVSVNDYNTAVEMFVKDGENYTEREPLSDFNKVTRGGDFGLVDSSGNLWKQQRRFSLKVLRDFGLGKNKMQERVLEETQTMIDNLNKEIDSGVVECDLHKHTDLATGSVINAIVSGFRYSANNREDEFYHIKSLTTRMFESFTDPLFSMAISSKFLCSLPVFKPRYQNGVNLFLEFIDYLTKIVDDHLKQNNYEEDFEPQDFIDAYLSEMHHANERGDKHYFSKIQLINTIIDLWFAGQETTSSTMTWGIAHLITNQNVQQKLHEELDKVIGSDRLISVADRQQLPYTNAVIMEIQRVANIFSMNLPRKAAKDVVVNGCSIKSGTIILPQISVIMQDSNVFKNPKEFNPSRFIDENGHFQPAEEVVPFSLGQRRCLGESLARMELFLFIANLFNQYKLLPGDKPPTLRKKGSGGSIATEPYKCRIERRF